MTTRFAQVLVGPAGAGKSTYIKRVSDHYATIKRTVHCVNLDPAAEYLPYEPDIDIREAVSVSEVMKRYKLGPNGALVCCLEIVAQGRGEWFDDVIGEHEYDYLLIDFPGQIEIYSHLEVLNHFMEMLRVKGYNVLVVYCMDSQFMSDPAKFLSGSLVALSTMTRLQLPHINILTKCDLLTDESMEKLDWYTEMDAYALAEQVREGTGLVKLTDAICELMEQYRLVQWRTFNIRDEEGVGVLLGEIDMILQYFESADYADPEFEEVADDTEEVEIPKDFRP